MLNAFLHYRYNARHNQVIAPFALPFGKLIVKAQQCLTVRYKFFCVTALPFNAISNTTRILFVSSFRYSPSAISNI